MPWYPPWAFNGLGASPSECQGIKAKENAAYEVYEESPAGSAEEAVAKEQWHKYRAQYQRECIQQGAPASTAPTVTTTTFRPTTYSSFVEAGIDPNLCLQAKCFPSQSASNPYTPRTKEWWQWQCVNKRHRLCLEEQQRQRAQAQAAPTYSSFAAAGVDESFCNAPLENAHLAGKSNPHPYHTKEWWRWTCALRKRNRYLAQKAAQGTQPPMQNVTERTPADAAVDQAIAMGAKLTEPSRPAGTDWTQWFQPQQKRESLLKPLSMQSGAIQMPGIVGQGASWGTIAAVVGGVTAVGLVAYLVVKAKRS